MIECRNKHGEFFGKQIFIETLTDHRNKPLREMIDGVYSTMKGHLNGFKPDDDISFMVVEYTG
jgi:serine phosphatase RsbU (regulator of sigma subunit)